MYPGEEYGYSIRYTLGANSYADIYIYPVPDQVKKYGHKDIVFIMTDHAVSEIKLAEEKGLYHDFELISKSALEGNGVVFSKVEAKYIKKNLVSYTLLYLTENKESL